MGRYALDMEKYADLARTASAEGCVLLKNDNSTLPLKKGDKVAVFGRMAFHYYKRLESLMRCAPAKILRWMKN